MKPEYKILNFGLEFISCILTGIFMGLGLDYAFGSKPLFFIVFLIFGIAAGFLKVYRMVKNCDNVFKND